MTETQLARFDDEPRELARASDSETGVSIDQLVARVDKVHQVAARVMKDGHHYGVIPGTGGKKTLLKPGAELLTLTFQLDPQFALDERRDGDHLESVVTCTLFHAPSGKRLGSGIGSCSTREAKYAWRKGERLCPRCNKSTIIKGKQEYGGGWICFAKKGGCGAKFGDKDEAITGQSTDRVVNPDLPDMYNTVRKMACKRAHVAAVLFVTGASEIFTQDAEDFVDEPQRDERPRYAANRDDGFGDDQAPKVNPHDDGGDYSDADPDVYARLKERMDSAEELLKGCDSYEKVLALSAFIGSKAKQSELTKAIQVAKEARLITPDEHKALSKTWAHIYREIEKEKPPGLRLRFPAPSAVELMANEPEADPEDFNRAD